MNTEVTQRQMKYCEGDKVYVIVSNRWIKPGRVVKRDRDFLTVSLFEGGIFRLRESRFYETKKKAQEALDALKKSRTIWGINRRRWRMSL